MFYRRLAALLLLCLPALPVHAATVLVFGDSLSAAYGFRIEQGWVALLQKKLPQHRFINASISGETTTEGLARLPAALQQHQPDVVILELGANDGLRGTPLSTPRENLQQMITLTKQFGSKLLLLGVKIPPNYGPRYTREFSQMFEQLAQENTIAVVPFFLQAIVHDPANFQADRLHPAAIAQPHIQATVWPALQPLLDDH